MRPIAIINLVDGGSVVLDLGIHYDLYYIKTTGVVTLTSGWAVTATGTPTIGMRLIFQYEATPIVGAFSVSIMGTAIPAHLVNKKLRIEAFYTGTAWVVNFRVSASDTATIVGTQIVAGEISNSHIASDAEILISKLKGSSAGRALITDPATLEVIESAVTDDEIALLDGLTAEAADLNLLDGAQATGVTASDVLAIKGFNGAVSFTGGQLVFSVPVKMSSGVSNATREVSTNDNILTSDSMIVLSLVADTELALPAGVKDMRFIVHIKANAGSAYDLTIQADGIETITSAGGAGSNSITLNTIAAGSIVNIVCYATGTWIVTT
jgi:hypothetical protein